MKIQDHIYSDTYQIHTHDTDPFQVSRFPFYCRLVQESAASHAHYTGCANSDLEKLGKSWVLSRFHIDVERYLPWPGRLSVETWIQSPFRFFAPREARGLDSEGSILFRSIAYWVVIDLKRRRPEKPDIVEGAIGLSEDRCRWQDTKIEKLSGESELQGDSVINYVPKIMYRDIDSVRHINNISYIEWIMESIPYEFSQEWQIASFDINFLVESFLDQTLTLYSKPAGSSDTPVWEHTIIQEGESGPIEACRARSTWKKRIRYA